MTYFYTFSGFPLIRIPAKIQNKGENVIFPAPMKNIITPQRVINIEIYVQTSFLSALSFRNPIYITDTRTAKKNISEGIPLVAVT